MAGDNWRVTVAGLAQRSVAEQKRRDRKAWLVIAAFAALAITIVTYVTVVGYFATQTEDKADQSYSELVAFASRREATSKALAEAVTTRIPTQETAKAISATPADGNENLYSPDFANSQMKYSLQVSQLLSVVESNQNVMTGTPEALSRQLRDQELRFQQKVRQYNRDAMNYNDMRDNPVLSPVAVIATTGNLVLFTAPVIS